MKEKIYSDGIHVISSISVDHLHTEMAKIGIKRCWFHSSNIKHYDIPKKKREGFFKNNPLFNKVSSKELIRIYRSLKLHLK